MKIIVSDQTLQVKILSASKVYFEGVATSLTASNSVGEFDLLPGHHNFICLLKEGWIRLSLPDGQEKIVDSSGGLLRIRNDVITAFLDV